MNNRYLSIKCRDDQRERLMHVFREFGIRESEATRKGWLLIAMNDNGVSMHKWDRPWNASPRWIRRKMSEKAVHMIIDIASVIGEYKIIEAE